MWIEQHPIFFKRFLIVVVIGLVGMLALFALAMLKLAGRIRD